MDNKKMLFDLIKKYRDILLNSHDYIICNQVLTKIGSSILTYNSDKIELDLSEISRLTREEVSMFTSSECERIVVSLGVISGKKGWRVDTVLKLIKILQQDIVENKMSKFAKEKDSLDELYRIVEEELFFDNYNLILDFIKMSVDNGTISLSDATKLNFYLLKECSVNKNYKNDDEIEVVELKKKNDDFDKVREELENAFSKYGYVYDKTKMGELDEKLVKYSDISFVDYVLSKFKDNNIDNSTLYLRKRALCSIIVDNDKSSFDAIMMFIDENNCTLKYLLSIPSVFSKKKRSYIEREANKNDDTEVDNKNSVLDIYGSQQDFLENIDLYKKLSGNNIITDSDLIGLSKFLCTPSVLIKKNLVLLRRYGILESDKLPKSILSLCGNSTEFLIDRYIELDLYDEYLSSRYNNNGELKEPRGASYLDRDNNVFKFYKLKRAKDIGQNVFASNAGIRRVFHDDSVDYLGISLETTEDGSKKIVQQPLTLEFMRSLPQDVRRQLPDVIKHKINIGEITEADVGLIYFENLYKYRTINPIDVFMSNDKNSLIALKGDRINSVFSKDYRRVLTDDEVKTLELDSFISLLDNAVYCDAVGDSSKVKADSVRYEFMYPDIPNVCVVVSRYKVLRLCKLLKEDGSWINSSSSNSDKENTLLSIILKDMIVSDVELLVLKLAVRDIITKGFIQVSEINNGRGAR